MRKQYLKIAPADNVAVAISPLGKGAKIEINNIAFYLKEDIPAGHKFSLSALSKRDNIVKYGFPIGHITTNLEAGSKVDATNLRTNLSGVSEYEYNPINTELTPAKPDYFFEGFRRENGGIGIRNEVWIVPMVGCVNGVAQQLARLAFNEKPASVSDVAAFTHNYGCSQLGGDHENTRKILRDIALHPNAAGVLLVGLGCENNQMAAFLELLGNYNSERIKYMECQKANDEIAAGMELIRQIFKAAKNDKREKTPLSELKIGLKCGGSDGFSGITANPLLGHLSDRLIANGGSTVLTEVPEMFGAETILMNRCRDRSVFEKTVKLINNFKAYFIANNQPVYENPSPGNKDGGISTLEEKSLGCTQKSGTSAVVDVLDYGDRLTKKGLSLLNAPGNDLVASTALAATGCQLILFTTGRGTPFGTFAPTLKISTNTPLYEAKPNWIDFDAGTLLYNETMADACERLLLNIIETANGRPANNEKAGYKEIAIFKTGVTL